MGVGAVLHHNESKELFMKSSCSNDNEARFPFGVSTCCSVLDTYIPL